MVHLLLLDSTGLRTTGRPGDELVDNLEAPVLDVLVRVEPQPQLTLMGRGERTKGGTRWSVQVVVHLGQQQETRQRDRNGVDSLKN